MKAVLTIMITVLFVTGLTVSMAGAEKRPQKTDEGKRARGLFVNKRSDAMQIIVYKNEGGSLVPVDPSSQFKAGDQIKLQFQSNFDGYIYVVNIAPNGRRCVLFPYPDAADNAVRSDEKYDIPPGGDAIEFDEEKGTEVLQVIMSRGRIAFLDAALKEPGRCLSQSASAAASELQAGLVKNVTPVVPKDTAVRARDIILAPGKDKDKSGSVVAIPENGGSGKLKPGEIAPFELRLKHN